MMKNFLFIALFFSLFSCSKSETSEMVAIPTDKSTVSEKLLPESEAVALADASEEAPPTNNEPIAPKRIDTISKKLIKNGEMEIQVGDLKSAQKKTTESIKKFNAYVQNERFSNTDTQETLHITIRVPHKNFDGLINSFSNGIGSVISKSVNIDDVTEEYTDVSIKLANKKIYLEKYRDLLKRAGSTKDMMEIQEKIRALEDEIDVAEGRLRYIDDRVNLSELNLTLYKEKPRTSVTSKIGFGSRFVDSIAEGWNGFVNFFLGIISLWPFVLLIPVIIFIFRKWKRFRKAKKQ